MTSGARKAGATAARDAAGLILMRGDPAEPVVLLGRRRHDARFMPGVFVPPGGGLEVRDHRPSGYPESLPAQPPGLDRATERRLRAFARCALRETLEETGLLVGEAAPAATGPMGGAPWTAYARAGRRPAFDGLHLVARAITPTSSPIRFHTRFFLCEADAVHRIDGGDGEIESVDWVPWRQTTELPMAEATDLALACARALRMALREGRTRPVERLLWRGDRRIRARPLVAA